MDKKNNGFKEAAQTMFPGFRSGPIAGIATGLVGLDAIASIILLPVIAATRGVGAIWRLGLLLVYPTPGRRANYARYLNAGIRFQKWSEHNSLTENRISGALDREAKLWRAWVIGCAVVAMWTLILSRVAPWHAITISAALTGLAAAKAMQHALSHWQLRTRALGTLGEFLARPHAWVPDDVNGGRVWSWIALMIGSGLLMPGIAEAAGADSTASDAAAAMIAAIFGTGSIPAGTPFTHALGMMINAFTGVSIIMLIYLIIVGMVATAKEGVFLGKKHNDTWATIRIMFGFGMLISPPNGSGLDGATLAVFEVAGFGSNLATKMWSGFVAEIQTGQGSVDPTTSLSSIGLPSPIGGLTIARTILEAESCNSFLTWSAQQGGYAGPGAVPAATGVKDTSEKNQVWDYGRCGGLALPIATGEAAEVAYSKARIDALQTLAQGIRDVGLPAKISAGHQVSTGSRAAWPSPLVGSIQPLATTYERALVQAAGTYQAAANAVVRQRLMDQAAKSWMSAGAYWRNLQQTSMQATQLASVPPTIRGVDSSSPGWTTRWLTFSGTSGPPEGALRDLRKMLDHLSDVWTAETRIDVLSGADLAAAGDQSVASYDLISRLLAPVSKPITQALVQLAQPSAADPMGMLMNLGSVMLVTSQTGIIGATGIAWATNTAPSKVIGGDGAFAWLAPVMRDLLLAMNAIGATLAYILPMIPFIAVYWLSVGWVIFLTEAIIAAPILALLFIKLDGEDFVTHVHKPALGLLFNFTFLPAFGVLGLMACYHVLPLVIGLLNVYFSGAYTGQQGDHIIGLEGQLIGLGLMAYLSVQATLRTCALVHTIPHQLPRWLGFGMEGVGGDVQQSSSALKGAIAGATASLGRGMGSTGGTAPKPVSKVPGAPGAADVSPGKPGISKLNNTVPGQQNSKPQSKEGAQ